MTINENILCPLPPLTTDTFDSSLGHGAAELVLETDSRMKTSFDDPQRLLEMLILQLAQEARRG